MEAAVRAARLLGTCVVIAREYRAARAWAPDDEGEDVRLLEEEHLRMQQLAGRAEAARAPSKAPLSRKCLAMTMRPFVTRSTLRGRGQARR